MHDDGTVSDGNGDKVGSTSGRAASAAGGDCVNDDSTDSDGDKVGSTSGRAASAAGGNCANDDSTDSDGNGDELGSNSRAARAHQPPVLEDGAKMDAMADKIVLAEHRLQARRDALAKQGLIDVTEPIDYAAKLALRQKSLAIHFIRSGSMRMRHQVHLSLQWSTTSTGLLILVIQMDFDL